ncbi:TROVE domain-containing protein [Granulicella pectinivorans]|uniref:TROVE domain-containing protein n=1 Tax=Granulicella pectinivorans TaxID=474950 RepID=A0A1I6LFJ3_9BACT|nr:TROVE domain-containing protein [Granulicella pectinivorans]SFS02008.1 TROVE domain-containing protein [Granulicella pectinivorans]
MKLNILKLTVEKVLGRPTLVTHEGAPAAVLTPEQSLRRSVLACMLWEAEFYESGQTIAHRICMLVPQVEPARVAALAIEARTSMKLRHAPLLLVREMARHATHRGLVAETLAAVIQRADELAEFVAIYWNDGRVPLSGQVKKGLAAAFPRFNEYQLAKYDRAGQVRLRDVLFLCHAKPVDAAQAALWKRLIAGELATPDTWEVALSAGGDKKESWERLLLERKLGALAILRNLRNMKEAQVDQKLVIAALDGMSTERVLPFRFLSAARYAPQLEEPLERAMFRAIAGAPRLKGRTIVLVDVSGSMVYPLARKSEMLRTDAAYGLAILLREIAEEVAVYTFSFAAKFVPPRRGFALRDAMESSQQHGGTNLGAALDAIREPYDRIVVITDEQSHDRVPAPRGRGYLINVASAQNGVGYDAWNHIDGFSEAVVQYIHEMEST